MNFGRKIADKLKAEAELYWAILSALSSSILVLMLLSSLTSPDHFIFIYVVAGRKGSSYLIMDLFYAVESLNFWED